MLQKSATTWTICGTTCPGTAAAAELRVSLRQYNRYEVYTPDFRNYCDGLGENGLCETVPPTVIRLMQLLSQVHGKA